MMILPNCIFNKYNYLTFTIALASSIGLMPHVSHATVYKTVTSDGKVVYTDNLNTAYQYNNNAQSLNILDKLSIPPQPSSSENEPQVIKTGQVNQIDSPINANQNTFTIQANEPSKQGDYIIKILAPQLQQVIRRGSQSIDVAVALTPALKAGDRIIYKLNNTTLATTKQLTYRIDTTNLDPKQYTIAVAIENIRGDIIAQANRDIYVLTNNVVYQQKRKALAAQKQAANQPWYKKIGMFK